MPQNPQDRCSYICLW